MHVFEWLLLASCSDRLQQSGPNTYQVKMLDSSAVFTARAIEIGLNDDEVRQLSALNLDTFGKFAFSCNYVPGQSDEAPLLRLVGRVCGETPPPEDRVPLVRRLYFESYTLAAADLRSRLDKKEGDEPRKLAQAERASRHAAQVRRLRGLDLVGELEPSHALVDTVFQMLEDNQLKYIRWEQCTKRDQELMGIKSDPTWKPDSQGIIREVRVREEVKADTSTDLRLKYALQRRSLALDQARLVEYEKMEKWSQISLEAYAAPALDHYRKVSIEQVQHADMELFKMLIRETRGGIKPAGGISPIDAALDKALVAPEVRLHLQPLQGSSSKKRADNEDDDRSSEKKKVKTSESDKLKKTIENLQGQIRNLQKGGKKGGGKGGKGKRSDIKMPAELLGQSATTSSGEPICYSFNLGGCKLAKAGEKCAKGWHVCTRCQQPHSQRQHDQQ